MALSSSWFAGKVALKTLIGTKSENIGAILLYVYMFI